MGDEQTKWVTRGGYFIEVNESGSSCRVSYEDRMEIPHIAGFGRTPDQPIPFVYFIGHQFEPMVNPGAYHLFGSRRFRVVVPYAHTKDRSEGSLSFRISSASDQYPVFVAHYPSVRDFLAGDGKHRRGKEYVIMDPEVPRIQLITLKVKRPDVIILLLHPVAMGGEGLEERVEYSHVRASDLSGTSDVPIELAGDPVFIARIHLRSLDLEAVQNLIVDYELSEDEIQFIRTFLQIMIKNERNDRDLIAARSELESLDESFRLGTILIKEDHHAFDREMDQGIPPKVAGNLEPLVKKLRQSVKNKDDEIYLWEVEYRLGQMSQGKDASK